MKFDNVKKCFVNDDGSKMKTSESVTLWNNRKYVNWCRKDVLAAGKEVIDNSDHWRPVYDLTNNRRRGGL